MVVENESHACRAWLGLRLGIRGRTRSTTMARSATGQVVHPHSLWNRPKVKNAILELGRAKTAHAFADTVECSEPLDGAIPFCLLLAGFAVEVVLAQLLVRTHTCGT